MKTPIIVIAFFAIGLIGLPSLALAEPGKPIQGTDAGLDHDPGNIVIAHVKTNSAGLAVFQNVNPGKYRITIGAIPKNPAATVKIDVPGQRAIVQNISRDTRSVSFSVRGSKLETVTVILLGR